MYLSINEQKVIKDALNLAYKLIDINSLTEEQRGLIVEALVLTYQLERKRKASNKALAESIARKRKINKDYARGKGISIRKEDEENGTYRHKIEQNGE